MFGWLKRSTQRKQMEEIDDQNIDYNSKLDKEKV